MRSTTAAADPALALGPFKKKQVHSDNDASELVILTEFGRLFEEIKALGEVLVYGVLSMVWSFHEL